MIDVRREIMDAAKRREVIVAVEGVYAEVAREVEKRRPVCVMSGRCCKFEEYGHRLFVTTMELAAFVAVRSEIPAVGEGCPFQVGKLCGVHAIRPFGCRMFFCDETAEEWQSQMYERFHGKLKRLHEEIGVGYVYLDWREALKIIAGVGEAQSA